MFAFVSLAQGNISEKILPIPMSKSLLPMFSSGSFIVSSLTTVFHPLGEVVYDVLE